MDGSDDARFPVLPQRLVKDVRKAVEDAGIFAFDNGVYKIWFARNYRAHAPNTVLLDDALATMCAGLPPAIAAKMAHPDQSVTAICGDGGFMMNCQELETAARRGVHIVVLILGDDGYGMIKWKQANMNFPNYGLDFGNPDFVKYTDSSGANGHRIESTAELLPKLKECRAESGVHLIDIPVDYSDNDRMFNQEIPRLSAAIQAIQQTRVALTN